MTRARTIAACDASATRFDWDEWQRDFDAKMNAFRQSLDEYNAIEAAIAQARIDMARDIRGMLS